MKGAYNMRVKEIMSDKPIFYIQKDHTGYITLNRPAARNQIDPTMTQELADICTQINGDDQINVVVIRGAGDVFSSDAGINTPKQPAEIGPGTISAATAVAAIICPTIAAINGDAIGSGLELALACDLRIARANARIGLPQITKGNIPQDGGTQRLSRLVGRGKALELIFTGEIIDAQTAFEIGLINRSLSDDQFDLEIESMVKTINAKAPLATRYAKEAIHKGLDLTLEQGLCLEADLYFLLHTTADRTEGIKSFLQKRPPKYTGK
jgi:enoyl-CoA hydratase/carnithine racemase